jgi:hypothetical protein
MTRKVVRQREGTEETKEMEMRTGKQQKQHR